MLDPWDVVCFPRGPEGAHGVGNETEETVRVLMFSTVVVPTATVYPDSDKVGIWTGDPQSDLLARRDSAVDYYDGETGAEVTEAALLERRPQAATKPPSSACSSPTGASCTRTATGCSARCTTPRTPCRRRCCGSGAASTASTTAARCAPGSTGSPPTPAST